MILIFQIQKNIFNLQEYNNFLEIINYSTIFQVRLMIITVFFSIFYVSIDALVVIRVMIPTLLNYYFIIILQYLYGASRPFWSFSEIVSYVCLKTFASPSIETFTCFFITFQMIRLYYNKSTRNSKCLYFILQLIFSVFIFTYLFCIYLSGNLFFIHIALGLIYFGILIGLSIVGSASIEDILKKSVINPQLSKRYQFKWLMYLGIIELCFLIIYTVTTKQKIITIAYITISLIFFQFYSSKYSVYEIIGRPFTFDESIIVFALLGGIFGMGYTFRSVHVLRWYRGPLTKRIIRGLITLGKELPFNFLTFQLGFLVPSCILICFQTSILGMDWISDSGLNSYLFDALHFFFLYFFIFGVLPIQIFGRQMIIYLSLNRFKLNNSGESFVLDSYMDDIGDFSFAEK